MRTKLFSCLTVVAIFLFALSYETIVPSRAERVSSDLGATADQDEALDKNKSNAIGLPMPLSEEYSAQVASQGISTTGDVLPLPATCFAPDTDPAVVEEFYRNREVLANSLGLPGSDADSRFNITNRWSATATDGGGLVQGDLTTLTWSYVADGTPIGNGGCGVTGESSDPSNFIAFFNSLYGAPTTAGDYTTAPWHALFVNMFASWSNTSGLIFVYEPNDDGATVVTGGAGVLGTRGDLRISGHPLDGNSGVLACNYFPQNGDMIIDTSDNYYANNLTTGTINVLSHEIGHGLGILHVCPVNQTKLMEPFVNTAFLGPQEDDILATNRSYGDPEGVNDTSATATFLGANANPVNYNKSQRSIDDSGDIDYFSFTISESSQLSLTLTPTGSTYLSGVQNSGGCTAGTSFNALTVSDLMIELLDTDGSSVVATSSTGGAGVVENIQTILPAAGTYFVRVKQQGTTISNVQMYDLALGLTVPDECVTVSVPTNLQSSAITDTSAFLSWDAQTGAFYDLRYRESGAATWTVIEDLGSASTPLTGLTSETQYEVQVRSKCLLGASSAYSTSILFTTDVTETFIDYCDAGATDPNFLNISRVTFNTIDYTSPNPNTGYADYTAISTPVSRGATHLLSVRELNDFIYFGDQVIVWIDYNQNGSFTDAGEKVLETVPFVSGGPYPFGGNITIPAGASLGKTTMRIRLNNADFGTSNTTPCGDGTFGEVEDYTLVIYDDYVYYDSVWTPSNPSAGVSSASDNILVVNGVTSLTGTTTTNTLTILPTGRLSIEEVLQVQGDIQNEGKLTFKSNASTTGQLGPFSGAMTGAGSVTVERYIPATRAFRFLSSAVTTPSSIQANWQEGALSAGENPNPGFGTHITGSTTGANGFDATTTGNPSMFTLDNVGQAFQAIPNTNTDILTAGTPYRILVRGSRAIDMSTNTPVPDNTTLRATGALAFGDVTQSGFSAVAGEFNFIGNPYQASVDMEAVIANSTNINASQYYIWDPTLGTRGQYVTVVLPSGTNTSSSAANKYLQPGQGAFVTTLANGAASILFEETDKAVGNNTPVFLNTNDPIADNARIIGQLYHTDAYESGGSMQDSFGILFSEEFTNELTFQDAVKPINIDENMGILQGEAFLSIERRSLPEDGEIVPLFSGNYKASEYTLRLDVQDLSVTALLVDNFTGISTMLAAGENVITFSVDPSDASGNPDRFSIAFTEENLSVEDFSSQEMMMYPNPIGEGALTIVSAILNEENARLTITNMLGQKLVDTPVAQADGTTFTTTALNELPQGIYFVTLSSTVRKVTKRIIKN